jgi:lipopolysaccharide transport system permease protein
MVKNYRRSFLGPMWITLNTVFFSITFGLIGAQLFKMPVEEYLPYFCMVHILFTYLKGQLVEDCQTFSEAEAFLKQTPYPKFAFALQVVWRNLIMLLRNLTIILGVFAWAAGIRPLNFFAGAVRHGHFCVAVGRHQCPFRDLPHLATGAVFF